MVKCDNGGSTATVTVTPFFTAQARRRVPDVLEEILPIFQMYIALSGSEAKTKEQMDLMFAKVVLLRV